MPLIGDVVYIKKSHPRAPVLAFSIWDLYRAPMLYASGVQIGVELYLADATPEVTNMIAD